MNRKYLLSIVILTMNRKDQVIEALESCMASKLPDDTEFVIVDNHSNDGTGEIVKSYIEAHPDHDFLYEYENANLGVGGGRSRGFDLAKGKYLYFLDDDAVISKESTDTFFMKPIMYLERNKQVASITTKIEDTIFKGDRNDSFSKNKIDGRPMVFKYLGGSHFLRKSAFEAPLYFPIQYGSEEYAPSITSQDKGFYHVYFDDIYIIHQPKINKWVDGTANMEYVLCCGIAVAHATKRILYPSVFRPIIELAHLRRCELYLNQYSGAVEKCNNIARDIVNKNKHKKIKIKTVIDMYKEFGLTVF